MATPTAWPWCATRRRPPRAADAAGGAGRLVHPAEGARPERTVSCGPPPGPASCTRCTTGTQGELRGWGWRRRAACQVPAVLGRACVPAVEAVGGAGAPAGCVLDRIWRSPGATPAGCATSVPSAARAGASRRQRGPDRPDGSEGRSLSRRPRVSARAAARGLTERPRASCGKGRPRLWEPCRCDGEPGQLAGPRSFAVGAVSGGRPTASPAMPRVRAAARAMGRTRRRADRPRAGRRL